MLTSSILLEELFPANSEEEVEIDAAIDSVNQEINGEEQIDKINILSLPQQSPANVSLQSNRTGIRRLKKIKKHLKIYITD